MYQFELDYTFTEYNGSRKLKPVTIRKTYKIEAESAVEAESILQDEITEKAPKVKREVKLSGYCKEIASNGQIIGRYELEIAFLINK